ncbi:MAG: ATP-binding protein [Nitrospirae bacterium]|nr:ATP-binding protein [Nitrospirota bacterium]MCL5238846.1 ATP-binding protein [Nitrospirota bacterium]
MSFVSLLTAGKEASFEISELIALVISCLMLGGVLRIEKYFRSIRANEEALSKSEATKSESENRYKRLVASLTDYIYTVRVEGRSVATSHGPGCIALTGYSSEEYEADPYLWYRMVHEEDRKAVVEQAAGILSGKAIEPLEHRIIHKNGQIRWVKNTPVPHYDQHSRLVAYDGLVADITERKKLEEQLRHSQKMEAVGQLAGGIAHDFNNILTTITGYGSFLKMKLEKGDPLMPYVEQVINSAERAANLTRQILAFSRKQVIDPKPVNLNETIKKVEKLLLRLIREDIELKTIFADMDLTIMADSAQIEQVLMNLCTNARDAMPEGGLLTIESGLVELDEEYLKTHACGRPGKYALISVADTGSGMDEKTRERIFEPFFTTKEPGKGTGLGLSIVYGIIKQHNGHINVYSELCKGTTFKIYLPLIRSKVAETQPITLSSLEGGTETILVAEDDKEVRKLSKDVLECFGYKVIETGDGEDTINRFKENEDKIQLLVLDVIMPKKNGREVYEEIRKIRPDIKVLFMSGYTADIINSKGILEKGANFISKPVSSHEFLRKVREVLDN